MSSICYLTHKFNSKIYSTNFSFDHTIKDDAIVVNLKNNNFEYNGNHGTLNDKTGNSLNMNKEGTSTITYRSCDNAGNCSTYASVKTIKLDRTKPKCTKQKEFNVWTNDNRTVIVGCNDAHSGCDSRYSQISSAVTTTTRMKTVTGTIKDKAGNQQSCNLSLGAYVDKTPPTYTVNYVSNSNGLHPYCKKTACVARISIMDTPSGIAKRVIVKHNSINKKGKSTIVNHSLCEINPFSKGCSAHGLTPESFGDLLCGHPTIEWIIYVEDAAGNSINFSGLGKC